MDGFRPGFEAGALRPFEVTTWPLARGPAAYAAADRDGARAKHVLLPWAAAEDRVVDIVTVRARAGPAADLGKSG